MIIKRFLIAAGNSTALVYNCQKNKRKKVSKKLLKEVEQVGFISKKDSFPRLDMMGNELCINATLALASQLSRKGKFYTSGILKPICFRNQGKKTTIKIPKAYDIKENKIIFNGIGFIIQNKALSKKDLFLLCKKYNVPAFGLIKYTKNRIYPYVYVKGVNSFTNETACGSGSIAFSIFTGYTQIIQPTGQIININIKKGNIFITSEVKEMK